MLLKTKIGKRIEEDTWGKGRPMIYMDEEGWLVEHWADGRIIRKKEIKMKEKLKAWNWEAFFVILLICAIGALGNESVKTYKEFLFIMLTFGFPFGLIWAYLGREKKLK